MVKPNTTKVSYSPKIIATESNISSSIVFGKTNSTSTDLQTTLETKITAVWRSFHSIIQKIDSISTTASKKMREHKRQLMNLTCVAQ